MNKVEHKMVKFVFINNIARNIEDIILFNVSASSYHKECK